MNTLTLSQPKIIDGPELRDVWVTVTDTVAAGWEETFKEKDGGRVKWV